MPSLNEHMVKTMKCRMGIFEKELWIISLLCMIFPEMSGSCTEM